MKKAALILTTITAFVLTSCQKEVINPNTSNTPVAKDIMVEYRVYSESGNVQVEMEIPANHNTIMQKTIVEVNRNDYSYEFFWKSNTHFSVSSWNTNGLNKDITVEIYIDGILFKSATRDHTTGIASASGTFVE